MAPSGWSVTKLELAGSRPTRFGDCDECDGDGADQDDSTKNCWRCGGGGSIETARELVYRITEGNPEPVE